MSRVNSLTPEMMAYRPNPKANYRLTPAQRDKIVELYKEGHKLDYIAALYGVTCPYVRRLARRRGCPPRVFGFRKFIK